MPPLLSSCWKVCRLVFVIFFLYLMGDAFYRWDGFSYYASFAEFVPNLCLVSIFWSILALVTAFLVWLSIRVISYFCRHFKWNKAERLLLLAYIFVSLGVIIFLFNPRVWFGDQAPLYLKSLIVLGGALAAIFIDWLLRNKYDLIQDRITPLVWIFGLFVLISIPVVAYHSVSKQANEETSPATTISSDSNMKRPNIILVTFDALTSENMSTYGYHRPTTPYITEWAKKASLFKRHKATSNYTAPTTSSILTGKRVWGHRVFQPHGWKIDKAETENIPRLLKQNGYHNRAYVANLFAVISDNGIDKYFDALYNPNIFVNHLNTLGLIDLKLHEYFGDNFSFNNWIINDDFIFGRFMKFTSIFILRANKVRINYSLEKMFNTVIQDIDNNPPEPFFTWLHIWQPHGPYLPPKPYKGMFGPVTDNHYARDRYDELIRYCDEQFKFFINALSKRGILKNTVIILSSDHGESFEHDYFGHGGPYLYEQVTNIPLIIKEYDREEGMVIDDLVEQVDISATILDLANIPVPAWMDGRSLLPIMHGKKLAARPTFSVNFEQNPHDVQITKGIIALWEDNYKLIYDLEKTDPLLFNLERDPGELNNIYDKEPEVGKNMLKIIQDNLDNVNKNKFN